MLDPFMALYVTLIFVPEPQVSLDDLNALPINKVAYQSYMLAFEASDALTARISIDPSFSVALWDTRTEIYEARRAWSLLLNAQNTGLASDARLASLYRLRQLLGYDKYYSGQLPPPVPVHRFPQIPEPYLPVRIPSYWHVTE